MKTESPAESSIDLIECNLPQIGLASIADNFGDVAKLLVARNWLSAALRNAGAESFGAGIGCGQADIDVRIGGERYNVSIRPHGKSDPTTDINGG